MKPEIFQTIAKNTYTLNQLHSRLRVLKSYLTYKYFSTGMKESIPMSPEDSDWLKSLKDDFFLNFNEKNLSQIFEEFEKEVAAIKPLIIYLPFESTSEVIDLVGLWVRANLKSVAWIDFKFDPNLIAGCSLSYGGVLKDFSVKSEIDKHRQEITAEFNRYFK